MQMMFNKITVVGAESLADVAHNSDLEYNVKIALGVLAMKPHACIIASEEDVKIFEPMD